MKPNFYRLWSYLHFLSCSENLYGIHSPFVYTLARESLFCHSGNFLKRCLLTTTEQKIQRIKHYLQDYEVSHACVREITRQQSEAFFEDTNTEKALILTAIHHCQENETNWDTLCRMPQVSLSIDLFSLGILLHKKGHTKEHFILRP